MGVDVVGIDNKFTTDCGPAPVIQNGKIVRYHDTAINSTVKYSCVNGYRPVGDTAAVCEPSGAWKVNLKCEGMAALLSKTKVPC